MSCRICDQGRFGGRLFRLSLLTVCCLARRDLPPCCFFLPETHVNGFRATYSGISGLSEAFLRGRLIFFSRFQGLGSLFSDAQNFYTQTTFDANFCQACGSRVSGPFKEFGVPCKVVNNTRLSRRVLEFSDTLTAKPYERQRSALEQQAVFGFPGFFVSSEVHFFLHFRRCY